MKPRRRFSFDDFEIDLESGQLSRSGVAIKLEPQPFRVLALLIEQAPALVLRDEIRAALWSDGTNVAFDLGLNYCIRQVRKALSDNARAPRYIATASKRGYRFLPPVKRQGGDVAPLPRRPKLQKAAILFREAEHLSATWERDKTRLAAAHYREVIRLEPDFPDAYAGLANALVILPFMGEMTDPAEAESFAQQAIAMDDSLALGHAALAHGYWHQWRWDEAESEFQRALSLDPASVVANQLYGLFLVTRGRVEKAIEHGRRAAELEPTVGVILYSLAQIYLQAGMFREAIQQNLHTLNIARHYPNSYASLVRAHALQGEMAEVSRFIDEWERVSGPLASGPWRAYARALSGQIEEARSVFDTWMSSASPAARTSLSAATVQLALGDRESAFNTLEAAVAQHHPTAIWLKVAPELRPLHADPRFQLLLARIGNP